MQRQCYGTNFRGFKNNLDMILKNKSILLSTVCVRSLVLVPLRKENIGERSY